MWETREVQLEWFGMLIDRYRALLNSPTHADPTARPRRSFSLRRRSSPAAPPGGGGGGAATTPPSPPAPLPGVPSARGGRRHFGRIRVDFERVDCRLYVIPADARVLALRHGPRSEALLLLRAASAEEARAWGADLMSCLALTRGDAHAAALWRSGSDVAERVARADAAEPADGGAERAMPSDAAGDATSPPSSPRNGRSPSSGAPRAVARAVSSGGAASPARRAPAPKPRAAASAMPFNQARMHALLREL